MTKSTRICVRSHAAGVREAICDLVIQGKLDAMDLKIIYTRDCSPMPTQSKVAEIVGISRQAIMKRVARFKRLLSGV